MKRYHRSSPVLCVLGYADCIIQEKPRWGKLLSGGKKTELRLQWDMLHIVLWLKLHVVVNRIGYRVDVAIILTSWCQ